MASATSVKSLIIGILLALLTNCILVSTSFTVGKFRLISQEICFVKAFLQTYIFSIVLTVNKLWNNYSTLKSATSSDSDLNSKLQFQSVLWVTVFSLATGVMTLSAYIGVTMMPVPDFVVLGNTASFFTLILSAVFLKQKLTILKISFCLLVIVGVVLVVQPTFLFKTAIETLPQNVTIEVPKELEDSNYAIGTLIGLTCSFSAGLNNVASAKCKGHSRVTLMIAGGIGTLLTAVVAHLTIMSSPDAYETSVNLLQRALLTVAVSLGSIIAHNLLVVANQNAPPTVVAVVRATEILLALAIDNLLFGHKEPSVLHFVGCIVVLLGVSFMAASDHLQKKLDILFVK